MSTTTGYIIDVPVTLSVAVRGTDLEHAMQIAREFAESIDPTDDFVRGYSSQLPDGISITEATLEASREDSAELLEELDEDEDEDSICECGRPPEDCATAEGSEHHMDRDDFLKHGN